MKSQLRTILCTGLLSGALAAAATPRNALPAALASAPVRFEPAASETAVFTARGLRFGARLRAQEAVVETSGGRVRLRFQGASPRARLEPLEKLRATSNILRGNDPSAWRSSVPNYGRLAARGLYPGIDLAWYSTAGSLEYDLIVNPGADPGAIRLRFDGIHPQLDRAGNLVVGVVHRKPLAYQLAPNGARTLVASRFRRNDDGTFSFVLGPYDRRNRLVIDPQLTLAQYVGGTGGDTAVGVGHDAQGFLYIAGTTYAPDFPLVGDSDRTTQAGGADVFVVKFDPHADPADQIVYTTYIGGAQDDILSAMTVDAGGIVYLAGTTKSTDFPLVGAVSSTLGGTQDGFVAAIDTTQPAGIALQFSTYLGGSDVDSANAIALDAKGRLLVTGATHSIDLPIVNGFQSNNAGDQDAYLVVLDRVLSGDCYIIYSTYLGGSGWDIGRGVAPAPDGSVWIVGGTISQDFTFAGLSYQSNNQGGGDAFLMHVNPDATGFDSLLYGTYLGGTGLDEATAVAVDQKGRVIVSGFTDSPDYPVTLGALQFQNKGDADVFLAVLNTAPGTAPSAQLLYSTYLGGAGTDVTQDLLLDAAGNIYLAGFTLSDDFPVTANALQPSRVTTGFAGFLTKLNRTPAGGVTGPEYSSFVTGPGDQIANGLDIAADGTMYVAGYTSSSMFDALGGISKSSNPGDRDAFLAGFSLCSYSISPRSEQFPAAGGSDTIAITTGAACQWTAASTLDWVKLAPSSGAGSGKVTITVAPNATGQPRQSNVAVAGVSFVVAQLP